MKKAGKSVGFLILNYNTPIMTKQCIDKIHCLNQNCIIKIYVVDNSTDEKQRFLLKELLGSDNDIEVITLKDNMGFSSGNNAGYRYLVDKGNKLDFLVVMNSDVVIYQKEFIDVLFSEYKRESFYVAGPDIFVPKAFLHANPMKNKPICLDDIETEFSKLRRVNLKYYIMEALMIIGLYKVYKMLLSTIKKESEREDRVNNVVLHGSCLIFSRDFLECNDYLFFPESFMYYEEDILANRCNRNKWRMAYLPSLQVVHLSEGSTNASLLHLFDRMKKKNEVKKNALIVLEKYLKSK